MLHSGSEKGESMQVGVHVGWMGVEEHGQGGFLREMYKKDSGRTGEEGCAMWRESERQCHLAQAIQQCWV